jgi:hypothetical protein
MMIEIQSQASSALPETAIAGPVIGTAAGPGTLSVLDDRHPLSRAAAGATPRGWEHPVAA